jgi:hypothetical protein
MSRHALLTALVALSTTLCTPSVPRLGAQVVTGRVEGARVTQRNPVVRTADPITRGLTLTDFPRTLKLTDNVYTYEGFHSGDEKFTGHGFTEFGPVSQEEIVAYHKEASEEHAPPLRTTRAV